MSNPSNTGSSSCHSICWVVAAVFGLAVTYFMNSCTGMTLIVAIVVGLIGLFGAYWVLSSYFCDGAKSPVAAEAKAPTKEVAKTATAKTMAAKIDDTAAPKETAAAVSKPVKPAPAVGVKADKPASKAATTAGLSAASDEKPALYTKAPVARDDLKKIKGVGPALEKSLHGMGIYTYAQIAGWSADHIAWVDGNLKFKGRITRDDWVSQATMLSKDGET